MRKMMKLSDSLATMYTYKKNVCAYVYENMSLYYQWGRIKRRKSCM